MPRLASSGPFACAGSAESDPLVSRKTFHPRRNHPLGSVARSRVGSERSRQGHVAAGRKGLHRARWGRDAYPALRLIARSTTEAGRRSRKLVFSVSLGLRGGFVYGN